MLPNVPCAYKANILFAFILATLPICKNSNNGTNKVTCTVFNTCDASLLHFSSNANSTHLNLDHQEIMKLNRHYCMHTIALEETGKEQTCFGNSHVDAFWVHNYFLSVIYLLKDWRFKSAVFVTDGTSGITPMSIIKMAILAKVEDIRVLFANDDIENLEDGLKTISRHHRNIVIICKENITDTIITQGLRLGLMIRPIFWIVAATQIPESLYQLIPEIATQVVLLIPFAVAGETQIPFAAKFESTDFFPHCRNADLNEDYTINGSSENVQLLVKMYNIFFSATTKQLESVLFANWSAANGLQYRELLTDEGGSGRMRGYPLKTVSYLDKPYAYLTNNNTTLTGTQIEIGKALAEYMNYPFVVPLTTERKTGVELGKGNWTGLVGRVSRREVDIGTGLIGRNRERAQAITFAFTTGIGSMGILFKRPTEAEMRFGAYLQPFTYKVWVYVMAVEILLYFSYLFARFLCNIYAPSAERTEEDPLERENKLWAVASGSVLIEDVVSNNFPSVSAKVLFGVFLLVLEVCFDYYTSIFTSFLTAYTVKMPFETIEELMLSDYAIGVVNGNIHHDILKKAEHGVYADVWQRIKSFGNRDMPTDKMDALQQVLRRKLAVFVEGPTALAIVYTNCTYIFGRKIYFLEPYYMPVAVDFPMKKAIIMSTLKLNELGIKQKITKDHSPSDMRMRYCEENNAFVPLGIPHVISLFIMLTFGIALSFLVLFMEIGISQFHKSKKKSHKM